MRNSYSTFTATPILTEEFTEKAFFFFPVGNIFRSLFPFCQGFVHIAAGHFSPYLIRVKILTDLDLYIADPLMVIGELNRENAFCIIMLHGNGLAAMLQTAQASFLNTPSKNPMVTLPFFNTHYLSTHYLTGYKLTRSPPGPFSDLV